MLFKHKTLAVKIDDCRLMTADFRFYPTFVICIQAVAGELQASSFKLPASYFSQTRPLNPLKGRSARYRTACSR